MLTNSLLAGALGAAYITVLVLQLNPQVPLLSDTTWRWFATFGTLYGVHLAVIFYVTIVVREFVALDGLSPGWASVRVLAWMSAASAAVATVLMWLNVEGFSAALTEVAARRMTTGAIATTASAVVLLAIAVAHYSFGRRGSKVGAALFVIAAFGSLALPLAARGGAVPPPALQDAWSAATLAGVEPGPRVVMLLLDGGSLDYVWPRSAEGRLPNFARLLEKGAWMDVATVRPTQPDPVWAAVATGMYASKNGVRSAASYYARNDTRAVDLLPDHIFSHVLVHLGFVRDEPNASSAWRARPLWAILADAGLSVGVVRWPLTYPAPSVPGFVVSDRFHQLVGSIAGFSRAAYPPELLPVLQTATGGGLLDMAAEGGDGAATPESSAMARDRFYSGLLGEATRIVAPRFVALRYEGLDTVGHYYFQYTQPRTSRGVPEEERRRLSQVIDRYYAYIDGEIGTAMDGLAPGDLLIVVSGFGMERLNPLKQAIGRLLGDPDFSGTHERAPDGFLLAYGTDTQPGRHQRGSIVDIAPTILYFLGLPIGRDMDGYARADLFSRTFTAERPIAFIPTYNR
jgi:predicted AlkP superfamily phosphohydrolase/phosphomutase